jgi:hypothetical protein
VTTDYTNNTKSFSTPLTKYALHSSENQKVNKSTVPTTSEENSIRGSKSSKGAKLNTQFSFSGITPSEEKSDNVKPRDRAKTFQDKDVSDE